MCVVFFMIKWVDQSAACQQRRRQQRRMRDASHCRIILFDLGRKVLAVQFHTIDKNVTKENSKRSLGTIRWNLEYPMTHVCAWNSSRRVLFPLEGPAFLLSKAFFAPAKILGRAHRVKVRRLPHEIRVLGRTSNSWDKIHKDGEESMSKTKMKGCTFLVERT